MRQSLLLCFVCAFALGAMLPMHCEAAAQDKGKPTTFDLHELGFPKNDDGNIKVGVFYSAANRIGVYFDQEPQNSARIHRFVVLMFDPAAHVTAKLALLANPSAMNIQPGPNGGVLFGSSSKLELYDDGLNLSKTIKLPLSVTGVSFDVGLNQLVISEIDNSAGHRTALFFDGSTLQKTGSIDYPIESGPTFGKDQLAYVTSGECIRSTFIASLTSQWPSDVRVCDPLVFPTADTLAYVYDGELRVVNSQNSEIFHMRIREPHSDSLPAFSGISNDRSRIAINAVRDAKTKSLVAFDFQQRSVAMMVPDYQHEVHVYDMPTKKLVFKRALTPGSASEALSSDGHALATIEAGTLNIYAIP
ncbi:MAG: hypothetical protein ACLGSD_16005 [Acidobacteriota bacterium]